MVIGVPGAGINGLFYLLLSAVMPLEELPRTLRGRSTFARWRAIAYLVGLAAAVALTLWGEYWVFERVIGLFQKRFVGVPWARGAAIAAEGLAPAILVAPFLVLGAVVLVVFVLGLALRLRRSV